MELERVRLTVVLLPHFDDEVFLLPLFAGDYEKLQCCVFVFIMSGTAVRKRESMAYMERFGVREDQILFLDHVFKVQDGEVVSYLNEIFEAVVLLLSNLKPQVLVGTAWEGGHQDHDAVFVLTRVVAAYFGVESFHFFTYNGYRTRGRWFRVIHPIDDPEDSECHSVPFFVAIKVLFGVRFFVSQFRSWIGLFPFLATRLLAFQKLYLINGKRIKLMRPHAGPLLYERYGRMTYREFQVFLHKFKYIGDTKVFPELYESS